MEEVQRSSIKTSQGSFIRVEDVKRIMETKSKETEALRQEQPRPKTMNQAKQQAMRDPELREAFSRGPREPGRAVPADS